MYIHVCRSWYSKIKWFKDQSIFMYLCEWLVQSGDTPPLCWNWLGPYSVPWTIYHSHHHHHVGSPLGGWTPLFNFNYKPTTCKSSCRWTSPSPQTWSMAPANWDWYHKHHHHHKAQAGLWHLPNFQPSNLFQRCLETGETTKSPEHGRGGHFT